MEAIRHLGACCATALTVTMIGCGDGESSQAPEDSVKATVERLQTATRQRDAKTICDDLYAAETRRSIDGLPGGCAKRVQRTFARDASEVRVSASDIRVSGKRATARVSSRLPSGKRQVEVLELRNEGGKWRVAVSR